MYVFTDNNNCSWTKQWLNISTVKLKHEYCDYQKN